MQRFCSIFSQLLQLFPRLEDGWPIRLQVRKENAKRAIEILTNLNRDNDPD